MGAFQYPNQRALLPQEHRWIVVLARIPMNVNVRAICQPERMAQIYPYLACVDMVLSDPVPFLQNRLQVVVLWPSGTSGRVALLPTSISNPRQLALLDGCLRPESIYPLSFEQMPHQKGSKAP
jgi:hypothetical protein